MHSIKHLSNKKIKQELLDNFLNFINDELKIDTPYSVYFVEDKANASDALDKTAMYNPSTKSVYVYVTNRHPKDIMRSIAHELVHHKQHCNGDLENMSLEKAEVQANAGGYYLRKFEDGRKEPETVMEQKEIPFAPGHKKCLSGQEHRATAYRGQYEQKFCYPKGFKGTVSKSENELSLRELYLIYIDLRRSKKRKRKSVFSLNPRFKALGSVFYPKIRKTIANVKNAPKVPADYSNQLVKYYELLKREQESRLQRGNDQEPQNEQANKIDPKLKKLILYPQSVIDDARRIYKMTEKGSGGQGDPFGFYYYGPDNDPFDKSIKIPPTLQKDIINRLGGQKRTDEIIEVYSQHSSSSSAINKADQDFAETVHLSLDVVGMSPDPLGVGLMADLLNGILYLSRGEYLDATFSFAGLTVFGDALKIERGPLRVFFRSLRNIRKGVIYFLDAKIARTMIKLLGEIQRLVFPRLKILLSKFRSVGITTLPGGGSVDALEEGIKKGEQAVIGLKNFLIPMEKLRSELSDLISWMYTGRLNTAMLRKLIVENLDVAKTILRNILANNPSIKKLLIEGDLLEKIINKYPAKFKAIGVDITGKTKGEIADIIQNKLQPILNKAIDILVDEATKNKAALETFLEDIFEQIDIIELDKKVVEILKTRFEEAFKAIFDLDKIKDVTSAVKIVADKLKDPNTLRQVQKEAEEVLKEILEQTLSRNPAVVNAAESFFKKTYRRALATVAPGIFRSLASFFSSVGNFASATVGKMIAKNVLGLDGLLGEMYKAAAKRMKQLWDLDALKIVARPGNVSKLGRLGFRLGKLILLWITSLPFFVLGKLNIFGIYYTRYYRHYCGGFEQFKKQIGEKALTELFDTWLAVGKYAVEVPLTITAALLEAATGGAIGEGSIKKIQKAIDQGIEYINKILNSKSSQSWYEELSDYIVGVSTAPFKCKKRDAIISSAPGFMRGLVTKEITELEKGLSTETLGLIRAKARGYNTKYQKMLKSVNDDNVSLPAFARMSQEQIGAMTPTSNIPTGQTVASPRDTAIKVADKVIKSKKTSPAQKAAAKKYKDQLGQDPSAYEESKSLSDYREKVLNERLEKLTIGFTK